LQYADKYKIKYLKFDENLSKIYRIFTRVIDAIHNHLGINSKANSSSLLK